MKTNLIQQCAEQHGSYTYMKSDLIISPKLYFYAIAMFFSQNQYIIEKWIYPERYTTIEWNL